MNNNGYIIPKDMKAEILIKGSLSLASIGIIIAFGLFGLFISNIVHADAILKAAIIIIHLVIGFIATIRPRGNPDRPLYSVVWIMFSMDKNGYRSLDSNKYLERKTR